MKNKLVILLIIILMTMTILSINVFAKIDTDIEIGKTGAESTSKNMINRMLGVLQVVGTVMAVISIIIIGMRYIFSSLEEKAALKGVIGYWLAGAILVFATVNVVKFAYDIITGLGE